ncbi:hypothetical protein PPYR_12596 [Photinus pyralis]|uniref:Protein-lysine N-methyltransferase SMYD4 n=1 Tax=Photinus pyralis TaxID=7054 RepID=A0A1Y1KS79_PHOPY|nr:SET and MYND domain-containing protein 4 [Photinus pyralis]KAB0792976.1 hypothetical protein PPYR_12596 [Photinus pyralis]
MCTAEARPKTVSDIFERLSRHLALDGGVRNSREFAELNRNSERVQFARALLERFDLMPRCEVGAKSRKMADELREAGNRLFKFKSNALALEKYTQSVAYAPKDSEQLALAFANRSAVLYELKLYQECLRDITQAFSSNYPQHLHHKLLKRRENAEAAKSAQCEVNYHESVPTLSSTPNPDIECASSCIRISFEENQGRHVVAVNDIEIGDVVAIEEPFTKILLRDHYLTHCYNCLKPSPNLIPCDNCVLALYCDEGCRRLASDTFHKYECPILATLLDLNVNKFGLLALKICILAEFKQGSGDEATRYKSGNYREIHNLITNAHLRDLSDLFHKAAMAAVIYELFEKNTQFFNDGSAERRDIFKDLLLLHLQTGPSNFHEISQINNERDGVSELEEIGAGAYAFLSLLNHSCNPNVIRYCYGSSIVLRALRPIAKGEQLFDNYGYHYAVMQREERRRRLTNQYFFHCECETCENNWPLYQELPIRGTKISITVEQIKALADGSIEVANSVMDYLKKTAETLEGTRPCKELADVQEILKQCYAIFGNRRQTF